MCISAHRRTSTPAAMFSVVPANDVALTVSTDRKSYKIGEHVKVKYRILNIRNAPLYVPREWEATWPANPHVWAWFESRETFRWRTGLQQLHSVMSH